MRPEGVDYPLKATKKPVTIDAIRWIATNFVAVDEFITVPHETYPAEEIIKIPTLEGEMIASNGDWIIKGVNGEFYPCKPDIFSKTYDVDLDASTKPVLDTKRHLCTTCVKEYPVCEAEEKDIRFGDGPGNDNICDCYYYECE